ncbi:MAG TPA: hypothetical protein VJG30_01285 [Candidatus Nanoarchaeia archaeon]|nr:hypothetical protein [Candidatus Nanoarchaeia archaeon]
MNNNVKEIVFVSIGAFLGIIGIVILTSIISQGTDKILNNLLWLILSALLVSISIGLLKKYLD